MTGAERCRVTSSSQIVYLGSSGRCQQKSSRRKFVIGLDQASCP